ncbi:hypothetical protein ACQPYK_39500 [Streptosporangium sp. CA-135522]|uniref:hypothetical protein n=1 Tax=Streptosporangium sp. CA-135522 TaxID=3240072 RepID=UPI003D8BA3DB
MGSRWWGSIVVLDGGRIVERGTHVDLTATGGEYARLFEMQTRGYREGAEGAERSTLTP